MKITQKQIKLNKINYLHENNIEVDFQKNSRKVIKI